MCIYASDVITLSRVVMRFVYHTQKIHIPHDIWNVWPISTKPGEGHPQRTCVTHTHTQQKLQVKPNQKRTKSYVVYFDRYAIRFFRFQVNLACCPLKSLKSKKKSSEIFFSLVQYSFNATHIHLSIYCIRQNKKCFSNPCDSTPSPYNHFYIHAHCTHIHTYLLISLLFSAFTMCVY